MLPLSVSQVDLAFKSSRYMKDEDVPFIHINIMLWQAMKQRELPCHDDEYFDDHFDACL